MWFGEYINPYTLRLAMERDTNRIDRCFDPEYRLGRLNQLRVELGLSPLSIEFEAPQGVSVGIEIEMMWWQAFEDMSHWGDSQLRPRDLDQSSEEYKQFAADYDRNEQQILPLLQEIEAVIPRVGNDAYWEFSFLPTRHPEVLKAELDTLFELGVLRTDQDYATHLTVAGVHNRRDAFMLLTAAELAGGTTSDRLLLPTRQVGGAWSRRYDTTGGMRHRAAHELYGPGSSGYEFRTLTTSSAEQIHQVIRVVQELATSSLYHEARWLEQRRILEKVLVDNNLPLSDWPHPQDDPTYWQRYAELIRQAPTINMLVV